MKIRLPSRKPAPLMKRPPKLKLKASVARARRAPIVEDPDEFLEEPEPNMKLSHAFVVVLVLHVIAVAGVIAFNSVKNRQADQAEIFAAAHAGDNASAPAASSAAPADPAPSHEAAPPPQTAAVAPISSTNASTNAAPAPAASTTPATAGAKTHEMQPGDTLTKIATQYGVPIAALQQANAITDPTKIRVGTVLTIPAGGSAPVETITPIARPVAPAAAPATESPAATAKVKDSGKTYAVEKGDNPVKIAKTLKVSYADLMALNGNPDPRKLQIGQKLKIPAASSP